MYEALKLALQNVFDWQVLGIIGLSSTYGLFVGSIPGLTATMAVALMVPLTFLLSDVQAIAAIVTTVSCSIYAGDIPATLVRIPGTPASAAYANDAYSLTRQGKPSLALGISLVFSVLGGLFGTLVLVVAAPQLAKLATQFTSYEYFWLYVLGLTCAAIVSDDSRLKGAFSLLLGLLLSTVGLGPDYAAPRLTFGFDELLSGVNFIPAMIGLFGISEVLRNTLRIREESQQVPQAPTVHSPLHEIRTAVLPLAARRWPSLVRSSSLGAIMGMLPGAGADIAAWISYAVSKRFSSDPQAYGKGSVEGIADATGANNAALGGAWIPSLVFGVPGDSVTAIAISVLLMKNIHPGPEIFDVEKHPKQVALVYSLYLVFIISNLILIPLGMLAMRGGTALMRIPRSVLLPVIVLFCVVGSFALNSSYFDVALMIAMGVLGFGLELWRVPLGPIVLGIILGTELEHKFIQCVSKSRDPMLFVSSKISLLLAMCCVALWIVPSLMTLLRRRRERI
ncbi:MAG: tripartite tricarboxylate transporter permease [Planctomycetales bacterium]|nr:tripartite tricarboxylate transporter permease [Planctomycetales bacterium]MCA9171017.1 tripartite tricarboxylate transporter permease [Planctomycetales bacterium]